MRVGGIVGRGLCGWRDCVRFEGWCIRRVLQVVGLRVGGIAGRGLSGLPTRGIAWQAGLPVVGLRVTGLPVRLVREEVSLRIACGGLCVCRRL